MTKPHGYLDVLRLTPDDIRALIAEVYEMAEALEERRDVERFPYECQPVVLVQIEYPGSDVGTYQAVSWNISRQGLGLLHGKFVYPESRCRVLLQDTDGAAHAVEGRIIRCRHLRGRVHEIGMAFDEEIEVERFCTATPERAASPAESAASPASEAA